MGSKQLGKLEELAGKRVDQSRNVLEIEQQKLWQIEHQRAELHSINQEYQQALVGGGEVAPQQLAYRRAFVEQLTQKLDQLAEQSELKRQSVTEKAVEHQQRTAQHTAIEIVNKHRADAEESVANQRQQQQLDEVARSQHFERNRTGKEYDND
ncbi:MAG: flagellar FliJ family protein [Granulosicoccus sp.]